MDLACKSFVPIDSSITNGLMELTQSGNKDDESEKKLSLVIILKTSIDIKFYSIYLSVILQKNGHVIQCVLLRKRI